jgi:hypothetical protein
MEKAMRNLRLLIGSDCVNKMVEINERDSNEKRRNLSQKERQPGGGSHSISGLVSKFPKGTDEGKCFPCGNGGHRAGNTSGINGISFNKLINKYCAYLAINNKKKHIGYY